MRVFIKSFGCSVNLADSEAMRGCLNQAGYKQADSLLDADVIIYNTCAVKGPTENRVVQALKFAPAGKKIIVAGCLPIINFERLVREVNFDGVVGPAVDDKIVEVVNSVNEGAKVLDIDLSFKGRPKLGLPRLRSNPLIGVLPVSYGCLGSCSYCCVKFARGHLRSCKLEEITEKVRGDLKVGVKEFWITSQDTACYGRDIGSNLAELINALCDLKGDFRVRVGMMTPNLAAEILDDLLEGFKNRKIFKFLHLPLQSGDNKVLKMMRRFYSSQDFVRLVHAFRAAFPKITLATDVICGFPGETEAGFENTVKLISDIKPDIVNISKFFVRPKTAAASIKEGFVSPTEIKRRSARIAEMTKQISFEKNQRWIGWSGDVLVDEKGKKPNSWVGRNFAYKPVVLKSSKNLFGKTLKVKVVKAFPTYVSGILESHNIGIAGPTSG